MKIKFVYGLLPVIVIYSNMGVRSGASAVCRQVVIPVIIIKPIYRDYKCILEHELEHARQTYRGMNDKLRREVEAFVVQVKCHPEHRRWKWGVERNAPEPSHWVA